MNWIVNLFPDPRKLLLFWVVLLPISYWWRDSVVWVVLMSHYVIIASHKAAKMIKGTQS